MHEITIESTTTQWYRAVVGDLDDGRISVVIFQKTDDRGDAMWKQIHHDTLDVPMHVARDKVLRMLNRMEPPRSYVQGRKGR